MTDTSSGSGYPSSTIGRSDGAVLRQTYTPEAIELQRWDGQGKLLYERKVDYTAETEHLRPKAAPPPPAHPPPNRPEHPGTEGNGNTLGRVVAPVPARQVGASEANPEVEDETPAEYEVNRAGGGGHGGQAQASPAASNPSPGPTTPRPQAPPAATQQPPSSVPPEIVNKPPANTNRPPGGKRPRSAPRGGSLIIGVIAEIGSMTDNLGTSHQWEDGGTQYQYTGGVDGGTIEATRPDGTVQHYWIDDLSGTIATTDANGRSRQVVSAIGEEVNGVYTIVPVSPEDALGYRVWQANGGEGTYQDWVAQGKPESPEDSAQGKDGGKVLEKKNPYLFENQLPEHLDAELARAEELGVKPVSPSDAEFDELINEGGVKYVVTEDGQLLVGPYSVEGEEISHAVLSNGEPVLTAGHADIVGSAGSGYWGADLSTHSGHFLNGATGVENAAARLVAEDAFAEYGIHFPPLR